MQHVDAVESRTAQKFELIGQGLWRVLALNVGEDLFPVDGAAHGLQVVTVAIPNQLPDGRILMIHEIEYPEPSSGLEPAVEVPDGLLPFSIRAKVVQYGGGQDDVEAARLEFKAADVPGNR